MMVNSDILLEFLLAEGMDIELDLWDSAVDSAQKWVEQLIRNMDR